MTLIEGQDLPEHLKLKSAVFAASILPKERGGGRFLDVSDIGRNHVVISTRIARDHPNADGTAKRVGQTMRIGDEDFTIVGLYETGSLVTDVTIVMEIGVARRLLKVADGAVSTFDVEPVRIADTDALAGRIEAAFAGWTHGGSASSARRSARSWGSSTCASSRPSAWRSWSAGSASRTRC